MEKRLDEITLPEVLWYIRFMPDRVMIDKYGVNIEWESESAIGKRFSEFRYTALMKWYWLTFKFSKELNLTLEQIEFLERDLKETDKKYYEPKADSSFLFYELSQNVTTWQRENQHSLLNQEIERCMESTLTTSYNPLLWWLFFEIYIYEIALIGSGICGEPTPHPNPKTVVEKNVHKRCNLLKAKVTQPHEFKPENMPNFNSPIDLLEAIAACIANEDPKFRCKYFDYLGEAKSIFTELRKGNFKTAYVENNELKVIGRGKRKQNQKSLTDQQCLELYQKRKQGVKIKELANEYHISESTVKRYVKEIDMAQSLP